MRRRWVRIAADIGQNLKRYRLDALLGQDRTHSYIVDVFGWVIRFRPDGNITDVSDQAIADAAGWKGDPQRFVEALIAAGIVDSDGDTRVIHEWFEHQGNIVRDSDRSKERSRMYRDRNQGKRPAPKPVDVELVDVEPDDGDQVEDEPVEQGPKKSTRFVPPTVEEIAAYCKEKGYTFDSPEKFHAHYEATNWVRGKTKLKSWKAACRTWELNHRGDNAPIKKSEDDLAVLVTEEEAHSREPGFGAYRRDVLAGKRRAGTWKS